MCQCLLKTNSSATYNSLIIGHSTMNGEVVMQVGVVQLKNIDKLKMIKKKEVNKKPMKWRRLAKVMTRSMLCFTTSL